ncbi:hypothetical protein ACEN2J_16475 [Pseudorhodobacter sp. W20_MBD10_FR17]|uniref:hypothetical protein n=1 Tax=Pseudorhodobacter sp. W20_MBD10_FR17 TaxID=3240266 RepID=UPI003F9D7C6E
MGDAKPSWKDIKPVLAGFSATQLLGLVQDLYGLSKPNAAFMHARFLSDSAQSDHLAAYKMRIQQALCPKQPWKQGVRLAEGRKAISDFKKANGNIRDTLALMTHYIKCGNDFTLEFGDIDAAFYDSLSSMFSKIVKCLIDEGNHDLFVEFLPLLDAEFQRVDGKVGWGYPDEMADELADLLATFP